MEQTMESPDKLIEGQLIAAGTNQLATELRTQRELAISNPRKEKAVFDAAMAELEFAPEFAERSYYVIPFRDTNGEKVEVKGPSVKASRALARRWGNCATASRVVSQEEDAFVVEGLFVDFETNVIFRRTQRVRKTYIPKETKIPKPLREDRLNMAIQAGMSKAERNATLDGLPPYLVESYYQRAMKIAGAKGKKEGKTLVERWGAMYTFFERKGVSKDRLNAYIKENLDGQGDDEQLGHLNGVGNALKDGQTTVEQVFGTVPEKKAGDGPVGAADLTGRK